MQGWPVSGVVGSDDRLGPAAPAPVDKVSYASTAHAVYAASCASGELRCTSISRRVHLSSANGQIRSSSANNICRAFLCGRAHLSSANGELRRASSCRDIHFSSSCCECRASSWGTVHHVTTPVPRKALLQGPTHGRATESRRRPQHREDQRTP